jgi:hypothetical protein
MSIMYFNTINDDGAKYIHFMLLGPPTFFSSCGA